MKKTIPALAALLVTASPAAAQLTLDIGGFFRGYTVYSKDKDRTADLHEFDLRHDVEIHFTGETTLDNGLTVGVQIEKNIGENDGINSTDRVFAYFSGDWGRVNVGSQDGAAYLLQVAAPSADSNVDGMRVYIQAFTAVTEGYDHVNPNANGADRFTYLSPKLNGFQFGASWAFDPKQNAVGDNTAPMAVKNADNRNLWDLAARWDGEISGLDVSVGGGFTGMDLFAGAVTDRREAWNVGVNIGWNGFSIGAARVESHTNPFNTVRQVVGAAWDNGPYHLGASYYVRSENLNTGKTKRLTLGGGYQFAPAMSFRGTVSVGSLDSPLVQRGDFTQITFGTDIRF